MRSIVGVLLAAVSGGLGHNVPASVLQWSDITPSQSLAFYGCFEIFQCARLDVPMNWNRTDGDGNRVAVAIMKIPAKVPITDERYGGAILLNPGGPGGSGIDLLWKKGKQIQNIVDATVDPPPSSPYNLENKYFDIISFDPRGMNNTTPQVICFPDFAARIAWERSMASEGTIASSDIAFATKWARFMAIGSSCTTRMKSLREDDDNILDHMTTPNVVGDMVAIIEALGEWRENEALKMLNSTRSRGDAIYVHSPPQSPLNSLNKLEEGTEVIQRTRWKKGEEKLQYWGFSYGTVLGATFAAMQPHRVGRLILDGVEDGEDYYTAEFKSNLNDTEAVWQKFFHYCAMAGPEACEFCSSTSDTEALLRKKFDSLLLDLKKQPIAVLPLTGHSSAYIPNIVTASDLLNYLQASTYTPVQYWPAVAGILRDLSSGNGTSLSIVKENRFKEKTPCATCEDPYSPSCQLPNLGDDPTKSGSVWCSDGPEYRIPGPEYMDTSLKLLEEQSPLFGAMWAEIKMQCLAWDVKPTWKYPGKFQDIETSHPIMWIGTTGDHVCPLANAHKMAAAFPGSRVLEQHSLGHCSLSSASVCTARHIRAYFQTGVLPERETSCEADWQPFEELRSAQQLGLEGEDARIWDVVKDVSWF